VLGVQIFSPSDYHGCTKWRQLLCWLIPTGQPELCRLSTGKKTGTKRDQRTETIGLGHLNMTEISTMSSSTQISLVGADGFANTGGDKSSIWSGSGMSSQEPTSTTGGTMETIKSLFAVEIRDSLLLIMIAAL
jgi:hypothetical protein